ncbi:MAG: DUF86 domain-containing protein, partial [Anaerolineales bacterium]|nr:DUF86 domain-containing protein [Anaerolineales bacterium]
DDSLCSGTAIDGYRRSRHHVSEKFQDEHPEIPWLQIIGQRNVLAHEYGDIKRTSNIIASPRRR